MTMCLKVNSENIQRKVIFDHTGGDDRTCTETDDNDDDEAIREQVKESIMGRAWNLSWQPEASKVRKRWLFSCNMSFSYCP